jgi:hypothetical protein
MFSRRLANASTAWSRLFAGPLAGSRARALLIAVTLALLALLIAFPVAPACAADKHPLPKPVQSAGSKDAQHARQGLLKERSRTLNRSTARTAKTLAMGQNRTAKTIVVSRSHLK